MSPDEHAVEAEKLLEAANQERLSEYLTASGVLALEALVHTQLALLASRPTTQTVNVDLVPKSATEVINRLTAERDEALTGVEANVMLKTEMGHACDRLERERDDLHWLVGHLARNAPDTVMLPPRLASVVKDCMDGYEPSRFTLAAPVPSTGEDQSGLTWANRVHPDDETGGDQEELVRLIDAPCLEGDCEDSPPEGEWCSHTRLVPASKVPEDVEMLPVPDEGSETGPYHCADCGWVWPMHRPPVDAECDNCGGELVPSDEGSQTNG